MNEQSQSAVGQVSQDGQLIWDGQQWRPITSHGWQPTSWTRPMQLATGGYLIVSSLISLISVLLFQGQARETALKAIQNSSPGMSQEMAQRAINITLTITFGVITCISILFIVLGIMSIVRRWTWVFYVVLVLFGLDAISSFFGLLGLLLPSSTARPPSQIINVLVGLVALPLFIWLLVGRIQRGVWACTKVPRLG